jgi:hypothetical protein
VYHSNTFQKEKTHLLGPMQTLHVVFLLSNTLGWRLGTSVTFREFLPEWETSRTSWLISSVPGDTSHAQVDIRSRTSGPSLFSFDKPLTSAVIASPLIPSSLPLIILHTPFRGRSISRGSCKKRTDLLCNRIRTV